MSPRARPTRTDATAQTFLNAAAALIDAALAEPGDPVPRRLKSIRFPAALDWLRLEDVVGVAREVRAGTSKKALLNRWPTKDAFIRDAVLHCLLYRDEPDGGPPPARADELIDRAGAAAPSVVVAAISEGVLVHLMQHPRSYLLMHLGPMLGQHPELAAALQHEAEQDQEHWAVGYVKLLESMGGRLRPGWDVADVALAVQVLLDGCLLRCRIQPERTASNRWVAGSFFAEAIMAFVAGVVDVTGSGLSTQDWLDTAGGAESALKAPQSPPEELRNHSTAKSTIRTIDH